MSDSKAFDQHLFDVDESVRLKNILDQLLLGNISVLTPEVRHQLSKDAVYFHSLKNCDNAQIECMRYLLLICNILYNRTDMLVLPVEDGVYDLLLET